MAKNGNDIATAYVQLMASGKGLSKSINKELSAAGSESGKSFGNFFATGFSSVSGVVTEALGAVLGFAKEAVNTGKDFDSAMSQVAATSGYTMAELSDSSSEASKNFKKLRDFAQEMGASTAFSATESAEALNYMALAGYDAETSMATLPTVMSLAAAGGIELALASDMVTDAQTALGLSLDETYVMVDQMAAAAANSNTSVGQLGDAFLTIGATARNLSGGTEELATMLGIMANNGIKGSEAGTHLRNIMLSMNPTTEAATIAWRNLGISAYDTEGNLRPLQDTFLDLSAALDGMSTEERTRILSNMFNKTDLATVNALLETTASDFESLTLAIDDSSGAAKAMQDVQLDNLAGDVTLLKSAYEGFQIAVSDDVTPTLREFTQFAGEALSELTQAWQKDGVAGAMTALGSIITDGIELLDSKLPTIVEAGMGLVTSLVQGVTDNVGEITQTIIDVIDIVLDTFLNNYNTIFPGILQAIIDATDVILDNLPEMINDIVDFLILAIPDIIDAGVELLSALVENLPAIIDAISAKLPDLVDAIVNALIEEVPKLYDVGVNLLQGLINGILSLASSLVSTVVNAVSNAIAAAEEWLHIGSPSKVTRKIGEYVSQGFAIGIESEAGKIEDAMLDVSEMVSQPIGSDIGVNYHGSLAQDDFNGLSGFGAVQIVVNASPGQNEEQIAELVSRKISQQYYRQKAVFA